MPTIGAKLGVGIGTMVLLCIAIGFVSYMQSRDVSEKIREITEVREPVNSAVHSMETSLEESALATLGFLSTGDTAFLSTFQTSRGEFEQAVRRYGEAGGNAPGVRLREGFLEFCALATEQIELRNAQSRNMSALLGTVDQIEGLLKGKIVPSIHADDPIAYRREQAALQMEVNANAITKSLGNFIITGDPSFEARLHHAEEEFQRYFEVYSNVLISSEEKGWKERLARLADESMWLAQTVADKHKARTQKMAAFTAAYRSLESVLNERLGIRSARGLAQAKEEMLAAEETANTTIFVVVILCVAVGLLGGALTTRSITSPIRELAAVMNRVATGGVLHRAQIRSNDEIRSLGEAFNMMTVQLERAERQRSAGLRAYAISVQRAQEDERGRIARELHDDISQRLSGMKFRVEVLADEAEPSHRRMVRALRDINQELDRAITEVQRISSNLRPSALDDFGLVTALRVLCKEFEKVHGVSTTFRELGPLPPAADANLEIALYRIAQEALANTAKHAHAHTAAIALAADESAVTLTVSDDGRGFGDADTARARAEGHGMGLMSMRERTELLGGTLSVASAAGTGTAITVTIPLSARAAHEENQDTDRR